MKLSESIRKFREFFNEAIAIPPRAGLRGKKIFVTRFAREFNKLTSEFFDAFKIFQNGDQNSLGEMLNEMGVNISAIHTSSRVLDRFHKNISEAEKLILNSEGKYHSLGWKMFSDVISTAPFARYEGHTEDEYTREVKKFALGNIDAALEKTGLRWDSKYEEGIPEIVEGALKKLSFLSKEIIDICREAKKRLVAESDADYNGGVEIHQLSSAPNEFEKMYHASINARQIYEKGFLKKVPDQAGLGGSQSDAKGQAATSFTYDLNVAKEIARSLKEMTMIAKGEIKAKNILDWIVRTPGVEELMSNQYWEIPNLDTNWLKFTKEGIKVQKFSSNNKLESENLMKADKVFSSPLEVATLFSKYLKAMEQIGKRHDPFFMRLDKLIPKLQEVDIKNIGIIVATIDTTNPNIVHKGGEREFRVPPKAIISVDGFI